MPKLALPSKGGSPQTLGTSLDEANTEHKESDADPVTTSPKTSCLKSRTCVVCGVLSGILVVAVIIVGSLILTGIIDIKALLGQTQVVAAAPIPLIKPPVKAACPLALKNGLTLRRRLSLNQQEIKNRFFNANGGPTNLFDIIAKVDSRIQEINKRIDLFADCSVKAATSYSLTTWGSSQTFYAQCADKFENGLFFQWGTVANTTYLYDNGGEVRLAATIKRDSTGNVESTHIWYSVGLINRGGSHGIAEVLAIPNLQVFEMTVAGVGLGFCGVQMKSDANKLYVTGSAHTVGYACAATDNICTLASDLSTISTGCSSTFSLPAVGVKAYTDSTWQASFYPSIPNVFLASSGPDDTNFGPDSPTPGVGGAVAKKSSSSVL